MSHTTKEGSKSALQKTLSGHEKLPEWNTCKVGIPAGSAISMLCASTSKISWLAASRFAAVKRWTLVGESHKG